MACLNSSLSCVSSIIICAMPVSLPSCSPAYIIHPGGRAAKRVTLPHHELDRYLPGHVLQRFLDHPTQAAGELSLRLTATRGHRGRPALRRHLRRVQAAGGHSARRRPVVRQAEGGPENETDPSLFEEEWDERPSSARAPRPRRPAS